MGFGEKVIEILDSVGSLMLKVTCAIKKSSYIFFIHSYSLRNLKKTVGIRENQKEGNWNRIKKMLVLKKNW